MKKPCDCNRVWSAEYDLKQCRVCWLATYDERYRRLFQAVPPMAAPMPAPRRRPDCQSLGKVLDRGNCNCPQRWLRQCERHGTCRTGASQDGEPSCQTCADYVSDEEEPPAMAAGVVIGVYNYPKLAELQVRLIRDHNGPHVPILIVDDCSPGTQRTPQPGSVFDQLCDLQRRHDGVTVWSNPERYGHAGGDLTSYFVGLQWAQVHRLQVLCKLSQRLLIDLPGWLGEAAEGLLASGLATGCQPCREGATVFPLRTEAILFDVARWYRADVLDHLRPRPVTGYPAELILWDDLQDRIGVEFWRWPIMGEDRGTPYPGIIWHCSHPRRAYEALAARYGLELDADFTTAGWQSQANYQW